ncbi:hypothetical protein C8R43DRAFT_1126852 [Mycena crocata]|nr:hypothetical protein C8R43DRAFT_1126852 [Mycena crocata]
MPMQTRSTTRNMVPPPSSASDSDTGSDKMDAPMGTSSNSGDGELGHSAKTHSSSQDDADKSGHRSRSADVGKNDDESVSHGVIPEDDGAMSDDKAPPDVATSQDGSDDPDGAFYDAATAPQGFSTPKKTSRASSVRGPSPGLDTSTKFFGTWFSHANDSDGEVASRRQDWADSTHADGPGEIPPSWIQQEPVSVELHWSPVVDNIDLSFDNLMREITKNLTPEDKE